MEEERYGSGQSAVGVIVLIMGLGTACIVALMIWQLSQSSTARYEAKQAAIVAQAYADRERARYETQQEQDRLDNKVEMVIVESAAHQERIATLAVALAGLNSAEEERLIAYERWWVTPLAWFVAVVGAVVVGALVIRFINPLLDKWIGVWVFGEGKD